ncbi:helix-turn-helix domain-containing protein [Pedobacter cryophilus]|uniref:Helix-turn-helix domain-containing protein n=1 Tax=Pedobacter cryophilus TaxID=2571271 RepID=A0A4U1C4I7_9SPHI|nr:helix-turn-helix domain-containing protein [Pedobacter cryophilus]TKC00165.1 helix-turn-helix domain-containing protein [Pedobacter cryophilus]
MENPFETILIRLDRIENLIRELIGERTDIDINVDNDIVLDVKQASKYIHLSVSRVYKFTSEKEIPHYKKGKRLYFKKTELRDWLMTTKIKTRADIEKEAINYIIRNPRRY